MASSFYTGSHRLLQKNLREDIDTNVLPHTMEWEEKGIVPRDHSLKLLQSGIVAADVPDEYDPRNMPLLAGIPYDKYDAFNHLILLDELSLIQGGVMIGLAGRALLDSDPSSTLALTSKSTSGCRASSRKKPAFVWE